MAGKRLLDAAKLLNAGRSIAKQHVSLRKQQWDVYTETSTLAKAVKHQTDRVTVTAGAAWELAKRFNETVPDLQGTERGGNGSGSSAAGRERSRDYHEEIVQDVKIAQNSREWSGSHPQDMEDPSHDDGSLSSLRRREQQRQSESQIPAVSAEEQPASNAPGIDTFSARSDETSPELSSLPRTRIPKHAAQSQEHDVSLEQKSINQDVFYSKDGTADTTKQGEPLPEGADLSGAFSSPRVSRMLGQGAKDGMNPYAGRKKLPPQPLAEMVAAERERRGQRGGKADNIEPTGPAAAVQSKSEGHEAEVQELASSIAQETQDIASNTEIPGEPSPSQTTKYEMRESRVPASRFGRLWQYGGLATSMAFGAVGESFRRLGGGGGGGNGGSDGSLMLSEGNMNRLVAKLSRMRGAALKLGQMMSFQDSKLLPPTINTVLQRLQDSADYMPPSQRDKVLRQNLGNEWREHFSDFEEKPFAAASIGQVHKATLASNGKAVAVKIQYPGVRNSIDSDLNNLSLLLTASRLLPRGLYLDKTIANARVELGWECDYEREARACQRFAQLVRDGDGDVFTVPEVYPSASGADVLTAEFMTGTAVTKIPDLAQFDRDWVGTQILRLCLRELMEWRFMQTDPNWTNFLYNREAGKLELLDFGASREFPSAFTDPYIRLLMSASKGDREGCRAYSVELGYLTGSEKKEMLDAHVDSVLTLAEPFVENAPEVYDFRDQTITDRVRANIGLMLRERLAPPPEETYSLHRKLSGAFLLCARLRSRVRARELFRNAVEVWEKGQGRAERVE